MVKISLVDFSERSSTNFWLQSPKVVIISAIRLESRVFVGIVVVPTIVADKGLLVEFEGDIFIRLIVNGLLNGMHRLIAFLVERAVASSGFVVKSHIRARVGTELHNLGGDCCSVGLGWSAIRICSEQRCTPCLRSGVRLYLCREVPVRGGSRLYPIRRRTIFIVVVILPAEVTHIQGLGNHIGEGIASVCQHLFVYAEPFATCD